ncbi:thiamine phosphate synthase [Riemerella anatipestifer]|nr:thiamine phosphate synthase [Riemerella anatipestifer]
MFIVITPEKEVPNEVDLLCKMAEFPVVLHIRKPTFDKNKMQRWLQQFNENQHRKMMLHQHHELIEHFDLKGIHLKEIHRKEADNLDKIKHYKAIRKTLSASFHSQEEAESRSLYDYVLLSPVFNSISKSNYEGKSFQLHQPLVPVIALGGITKETMLLTPKMGFSGVAVLGSLWNSSQAFDAFKELFAHYKKWY